MFTRRDPFQRALRNHCLWQESLCPYVDDDDDDDDHDDDEDEEKIRTSIVLTISEASKVRSEKGLSNTKHFISFGCSAVYNNDVAAPILLPHNPICSPHFMVIIIIIIITVIRLSILY